MDIINTMLTWAIGIFDLTESINEKSISATAIPVDSRSKTTKHNIDEKSTPITALQVDSRSETATKYNTDFKCRS